MRVFRSTVEKPFEYVQDGLWRAGTYTYQALVKSAVGYAFAFQYKDLTWEVFDCSWQLGSGFSQVEEVGFELKRDAIAFKLIANPITGEILVGIPMLEDGTNKSTPIAHEEDLRGMDGDFHEFIFTRNDTGIAPPTPLSTQENDHIPIDDSVEPPVIWTDNPQGVTKELPFEFVSMREKKNGVWLNFSPPSLWAKWAEDGFSLSLQVQGHFVSHWEGTEKVTEIVGGEYIDDEEVVKVTAVIRKGEKDVTVDELQSRGFRWYVNGFYNPAWDNQPHITLDETYGDGFADFVILSYLVNSLREEVQVEVMNLSEGMDGIGEEFIFIAHDSEVVAPELPQPTDEGYQEDDYHGHWSDDPVSPTEVDQFVWSAKRKKVGGIWEAFGAPSVWTRWVEDGKDAIPPIIIDGFWAFWNEDSQSYIKSSFSAEGDDGHSPYINTTTGTWWEWSPEIGEFKNTFIKAEGKDAVNIIMSPSSHSFATTPNGNAKPRSVYLSIKATRGETPVTISASQISISGYVPYGMTVTKGTNQVVLTVNSSFTPLSEGLEIYVTINSVSYLLVFLWDSVKDGEDGDGILEVIDYYGVSLESNVLPTTWYTNVPTKGVNEYLWNYERILYTDGTYDETEPRVIQGKDAISISTIKNQYVYSSSDTSHPTSGWKPTISELGAKPEGYFLWVRDFITYTDGTTSTTDGYVVKDGDDGDGITSTTIHYARSESGTATPTSGWGTSIPEPIQGWYLWTRTTTTYKVAETTVSYSVSHWAEDGDGIVSTTIHYQKSSSGTAIPGSWRTSIPTPTKGWYLWTRTTTEYKKSPPTVAYSVSYWAKDGDKGDKGEDGLPPEVDETIMQYALGSSKTEPPTLGWVDDRAALVPDTLTPYEWSRQKITYKNSTQVIYVGYVLITNISPMTYFFGEWDCRVKYTRNEKSYPIVTYKKGTNNKPLYYYPKNEGVIEYIQFVKPDVNYSSTWYKKGDIVWYENDGSNGDPVCPLGIFKSKLNNNRYLPTTSSWWDNVTADYAPNGVEGQKLWEFADGVELIITEAIMANFAKFDSFVFHKGKMFSQEGTLNGVSSNEYTDEDHEPNYEVDGKSGKVKMKDAEVEGVIVSRNNMGSMIASMNIEDKGEYIQYYPSGNKMMEFNGGVITYYENNEDNTVLWTLGREGAIISGEIDRWKVITLTATTELGSGIKQPYIDGVEWRVFVPGSPSSWGSYRGLTITNDSFNYDNPSNIPPVAYIPNGWYTNSGSAPMIFDGGYYREIVYYQSGYKTNSTKIITF